MPEHAEAALICPYLRGRRQIHPHLTPSDENHCLVTASIHLPHPQQTRFCLGGRYETCSRFQQQQQRPLPRYVTGVTPTLVTISPPPPPLTPLLWRRPWFRSMLQILFMVLIVILVIWGWRWQQTQVRVVATPVPLATPAYLPIKTPPSLFEAPVYSVPAS